MSRLRIRIQNVYSLFTAPGQTLELFWLAKKLNLPIEDLWHRSEPTHRVVLPLLYN